MKFTLHHADTCLPDYWSGHHLPHVSIPVWKGMTITEVKHAINLELRFGYVMGHTPEARMLSADWVTPEEAKQAGRVQKAAFAAVNKLKLGDPKKRKLFADLPGAEDSEVMAYFVFELED